jgi:hypothetical protein
LTVISESVSPDLESYLQTYKNVAGQSGYPNWYTTENDVSEGAIRTAVTAVVLSIGVEQRREAPINITGLLQTYNPTRVIVKEISCESKWSGTGLVSSEVVLALKNINKQVLHEFNVASGNDDYQNNSSSPGLDVTGQSQFLLEVYHGVRAEAGGNDVKTRQMTVTFELETATTIYDIYIRLQDEQGNLMYGARARIGSLTYDFPNGESTIQLPEGTYTIEAWAHIEERTYRGNSSFKVPDDPQVTVTLQSESWLPDWWWIIPVGVGGIVVTYVAYKLIKGERPSFIVVR